MRQYFKEPFHVTIHVMGEEGFSVDAMGDCMRLNDCNRHVATEASLCRMHVNRKQRPTYLEIGQTRQQVYKSGHDCVSHSVEKET